MKKKRLTDHDLYTSLRPNADDLVEVRPSVETDRKMHRFFSEHEPRRSFFMHPVARFGAVAAFFMVAMLVTLNILIPNRAFYYFTYTRLDVLQGAPQIIRKAHRKKQDDRVYAGDRITTDGNARAGLILPTGSSVTQEPDTHMRLVRLTGRSKGITRIEMFYGEALFEVKPLTGRGQFRVITPDVYVDVVGTKFIVSVTPDVGTEVEVHEGRVTVRKRRLFSKMFEVNAGYTAFCTDDGIVVRRTSVDSEVNGKTVMLEDGQVDSLPVDVTPVPTSMPVVEKKFEFVYETQKIYTVKNSGRRTMIDFVAYKERVIAVYEAGLICFDRDNKVLWEYPGSKGDGFYFMSPAVVYGDTIIISTINNILLVIDAGTGAVISKIKSPGNIAYGYRPVIFENQVYLPFESGLYVFDPTSMILNETPVIRGSNLKTPLITEAGILVSSYLDTKIQFYAHNGDLLYAYNVKGKTYKTPVVMDATVYMVDHAGVVYRGTDGGPVTKVIDCGENILSDLTFYNKYSIFTLLNDGALYRLDLQTQSIAEIAGIDEDVSPEHYVYKKPAVMHDLIVLGNSRGRIFVYDPRTAAMVTTPDTGDFHISTTARFIHDRCYLGTKTGDVIIMK